MRIIVQSKLSSQLFLFSSVPVRKDAEYYFSFGEEKLGKYSNIVQMEYKEAHLMVTKARQG